MAEHEVEDLATSYFLEVHLGMDSFGVVPTDRQLCHSFAAVSGLEKDIDLSGDVTTIRLVFSCEIVNSDEKGVMWLGYFYPKRLNRWMGNKTRPYHLHIVGRQIGGIGNTRDCDTKGFDGTVGGIEIQ